MTFATRPGAVHSMFKHCEERDMRKRSVRELESLAVHELYIHKEAWQAQVWWEEGLTGEPVPEGDKDYIVLLDAIIGGKLEEQS